MSAAREAPSPVHPRNHLNGLSNGEWLRLTKSFWLSAAPPVDEPRAREAVAAFAQWLREQHGDEEAERLVGQVLESFVYSITPPRDGLKARHPATFAEPDIERLVSLFTTKGELVLDPFAGVGSALIAAIGIGRHALGIEISPEWADVARTRIGLAAPMDGAAAEVTIGDSRAQLGTLLDSSVDFVVTSPPYWAILNKQAGMKVQAERISRGLATDYGDLAANLGNIENYHDFLGALAAIFGECLRVVRPGRYMAVIVSDFRHGERFYLYHADLSAAVERTGWVLSGVTVLAQDNKTLYPYGIPYAFVSNVHHQYILLFRKPKPATRRRQGAGRHAANSVGDARPRRRAPKPGALVAD